MEKYKSRIEQKIEKKIDTPQLIDSRTVFEAENEVLQEYLDKYWLYRTWDLLIVDCVFFSLTILVKHKLKAKAKAKGKLSN